MGRRRQGNHDDPPRFHRKGNTWYHVSGTSPRIWTKLSADRVEALRLWAQREGVREDESTKLFSVVARRYVREVFPTKSIQTRKDNDKELANLLKVFALVPMDAIAPMHIRQYMDIRGEVGKIRASREKVCYRTFSTKPENGAIRRFRTHAKGSRASRRLGALDTSQMQSLPW